MAQTKLEFISFSWKRLVAALLFLAVSILNIAFFGVFSGRHIPTGSIISFEGPSYFFSSGLLPTIIAMGLIVYCFLSFFRGSIESDEETIHFTEKRFRNLVKTDFSKHSIVRMELTNNAMAIKYLWLFLLIPYLIVNYYYMILNFNQPFLVGPINLTAVIILLSILLSSIGMIVLFHFPQWLLTIYTDCGKYELWFEPYKRGRELAQKIAETLEIIEGKNEELIKIDTNTNMSQANLLLTAFFLIYGLYNIINFMTSLAIFQTIVVYPMIIVAVYLFSKELRKLPLPTENSVAGELRYNLKSRYYQKYLFIKNYREKKIERIHHKFDLFWVIIAGIIFIFVPFKIIQIWMILNEDNILILIDNAIILTVFGGCIMLLISLYILTPVNQVIIQTNETQVIAPKLITSKSRIISLRDSTKNVISAFRLNFKNPELKRQFFKRSLFMLITLMVAVLLIIWQYFFYINLFNIFNF